MIRNLGLLALVVALIAIANIVFASWVTIDRDDLGISSGQGGGCTPPVIPSFWQNYRGFPDYDNELISDHFGIYAAYAANAYEPISRERFNLKPDYFGWVPQGEPIVRPGGFYAEVYSRQSADRLSVMMVFRGRESATGIADFISEISFLTQMINPWDQYRTARKEFAKLRVQMHNKAPNLPVEYIAVGHELGGGLARHMAAAFPCTAAIVFNSTFISNNRRLAERYDGQVVDLFTDNDLSSRLAILRDPQAFFRITRSHQWYRVRNAGDFSGRRGMLSGAVAMARTPVLCLLRADCALNQKTTGEAKANPQRMRSAAEMSALYCLAGPNSEGSKSDVCK